MPTKPLQTILWREMSLVEAKDIIEIASPLLQELVNYSTNVLARCLDTAGAAIEHLAAFSFYRHIIEMTDGVEVLISQSCAVPAIPLVRSSFEALLSIEYILEKDYELRSLSWLVDYARKGLAVCEMLDPSTQSGKDFQKALNEGEGTHSVSPPGQVKVQKVITDMQGFLDREEFKPVHTEYEKLRKGGSRRGPTWYQLWGGPRNLRELACHLKKEAWYDFLYRYWSRLAHAQDFSHSLIITADGHHGMKALRDPSRIKEVAQFASNFSYSATRQILAKFRPGEDLSDWYIQELERLILLLLRA